MPLRIPNIDLSAGLKPPAVIDQLSCACEEIQFSWYRQLKP